ncbi:MAG: hypothetical protein PVSMB1_18620 [Gemmatimonadaceae bacterium]
MDGRVVEANPRVGRTLRTGEQHKGRLGAEGVADRIRQAGSEAQDDEAELARVEKLHAYRCVLFEIFGL